MSLLQYASLYYDKLLKPGFLLLLIGLTVLVIVNSRRDAQRSSATLLLGLLGALPFIVSFRYQPNPVFPSELTALLLTALLGLNGALTPADDRGRSGLPWACIGWFALIGALGAQLAFQPFDYYSEKLIPMLYALTAATGAWGVVCAIRRWGSDTLINALIWGIIFGALFNSVIAAAQVYQILTHGWQLVFGNIGQKNMYGHYIGWALAGVTWLLATQRIGRAAGIALAVWLALALAWSSSRSPFLYGVAFIGMGSILAWRARDEARRLGGWLLMAGALVFAMQFISPIIINALQAVMQSSNEVPTGLDRLDANGSRRLVEWQKAWEAFQQAPWLGHGWGSFPAISVEQQVRPEFAVVQESVLFTHAHSSLLNLLAETGVIGTLGVLGGILITALLALRGWRDNAAAMVALAMLAVSVLHSLVEYPLWYFHFLGIFAVLLAFASQASLRWPGPANERSVLMVFAPMLLLLCLAGGYFYAQLYPIFRASGSKVEQQQKIARLVEFSRLPLIDYYAERALTSYIRPSRTQLQWKLEVLRRNAASRPYPAELAHLAILETLNGNALRGHQLMRQAAYAFPEQHDYLYAICQSFSEADVRGLTREIDTARKLLRPNG